MTPSIFPFEQQFAHDIYTARYEHPQDDGWYGTARRVSTAVMPALFHAPGAPQQVEYILNAQERVEGLIARRQFVPGGRYLYAAGRDLHQVNNCILLRPEDSREGWGELGYRADMATMTGAGIGVWYGDIRPAGAGIGRTGGVASGPMGLARKTNDGGRELLQGGNRRCAVWAGLPWWHPDVFDIITCKDWPEWLRQKKEEDPSVHAPMDSTNVSVTLDDAFLDAYHGRPMDPGFFLETKRRYAGWRFNADAERAPDGTSWHEWAKRVYDTAVGHMLKHGEPGFTMDRGDKRHEVLRNACTEITSADDSDVCNLGSLVLSRFHDPQQFGAAVRDAVLFLTAGTLYSDVPYAKVADVRAQNRRLGLGLIGVHEFLMNHRTRYGTPEAFEVLEPYMREYARALEYAHFQQDLLGLSLSAGATAIAPNGTIGIVAESTPSADPMFSKAEIRTVVQANVHGPDIRDEHVVVDIVAARAAAAGVPLEYIEDAYDLAQDPERRLAQTAYLQRYTDHAISGTVNLPAVVSAPAEARRMGDKLMRYLPDLRGITFYPDGARAGQPRRPMDLEWALQQQNVEIASEEERCAGGVCSL